MRKARNLAREVQSLARKAKTLKRKVQTLARKAPTAIFTAKWVKTDVQRVISDVQNLIVGRGNSILGVQRPTPEAPVAVVRAKRVNFHLPNPVAPAPRLPQTEFGNETLGKLTLPSYFPNSRAIRR